MTAESRWQAALAEHRAAIQGYAAAVSTLDDDGWTRPWAPGKWTPAQITEHLTFSYGAFLKEVRGEGGMRMKVFGLRLRVLRWFVLPHILFHRSFPGKAVSPREIRPAGGSPDRRAALDGLLAAAREAERELEAARGRPGVVITHPYFGGIAPAKALRFQAIHVEHHERQVRRAVEGASSAGPAPDTAAPGGR